MENDTWGNITVNWDAYLLMLMGLFFFIWFLVRIIKISCKPTINL